MDHLRKPRPHETHARERSRDRRERPDVPHSARPISLFRIGQSQANYVRPRKKERELATLESLFYAALKADIPPFNAATWEKFRWAAGLLSRAGYVPAGCCERNLVQQRAVEEGFDATLRKDCEHVMCGTNAPDCFVNNQRPLAHGRGPPAPPGWQEKFEICGSRPTKKLTTPRQLDPADQLVGGPADIAAELGEVHHLLRSANLAKIDDEFLRRVWRRSRDRCPEECGDGAATQPAGGAFGNFDKAVALFRVSPIKECAMDWNRVEGNWKQVKGKVKEKWGKLTDDDLDVINGRRDQLEGKIQERYGIAKDQTRKDIDDWYSVQKW